MFFDKYLQDGEEILYIVHRHWWSIVIKMFSLFIGYILIPVGLYIYILRLRSIYSENIEVILSSIKEYSDFVDNLSINYVLYLVLFLALIGLLKMGYRYLHWYSDVFMLTDLHLIYIEWNGFFDKESVRINYGDIESVDVHINGIAQTMLKFGRLEVETANETTDVVLTDAVRPSEAQGKIFNIKKQYIDATHKSHAVAAYDYAEEHKNENPEIPENPSNNINSL